MEQISEKSRQIAKAINEQRTGSSQIFMSVEKIKDVPVSNIRTISDINQSLTDLLKNAGVMNKQIEGIRISEETPGSGIESVGAHPSGGLTVSRNEHKEKG